MSQSHRFRFLPTAVLGALLLAFGLIALASFVSPGRAHAAPQAPAEITVAHFAPFAADVAATAVDVRVNGATPITDFVYAEVISGVQLPGGVYTLEVLLSGTSTVAISGSVPVSDDMSYTLAAIGGANGWPLALYALPNETTPPTGAAHVRITHLAPFAADADATRVDVCTQGGDVVGTFTDIPYGETTGYFELPPGDYDLKVTAAGSGCATVLIDPPSIRLTQGDILDLFAIGGNSPAFPVTVTSTGPITFTPPARVAVAHFAPFGNDPAATSVTVRVDGVNLYTNFAYSQTQPYAEVPAGSHLIEIVPTGTSVVAISGTVTVTGGLDYSLIAIGDGVNQPLQLLPLPDEMEAPAAGFAKVRIGHLAPFAAELADTAVDVCTEENAALPELSGVVYGVVSPYLTLPAGAYDLKIALANTSCSEVALDLPAIQLASGEIADLFAVGSGTAGFPVSFASITGITTVPPTALDVSAEPAAPALNRRVFLPVFDR